MRPVLPTFAALAVIAITGAQAEQALPPAENSRDNWESGAVVVSGPQHVQDTTLRNGIYWGEWNYGKSQFLQAGVQPSTVYDIYQTVSLIRFDLAGLPYTKVASAKLRLYFPRNLIQQSPIPIHIYAVSIANAGWREGSSEAEEQSDACSWSRCAQRQSWAGGPGMSQPGVDYASEALDTKIVSGLQGEWIEFQLPEKLVQSWMDNPDKNSGLLVKTDDGVDPGQSTYMYSSQHWSGKGPQLVLTGNASSRLVSSSSIFTTANYNRPFQLPPKGPVYNRWLHEKTARYAVWAQDKSINLTGTQALFPYLWDIVFRADIILPKAILPLSRETEEIPTVVASGDKMRARQIMKDFMKYIMVFDYARDQNWYDSGPTADVLSPLQIAQFFVKSDGGETSNGVHGIYSQYDDGRWADSADSDSLETAIQAQLTTIKQRLKPSPAQFEKIEAVVRENMPLEKFHARELKKNLDMVRQLIAKRVDGTEMLQALRGMFFHHRMFLIHQSFFSMPKYSAFIENGDILSYAQWFYEVRHGQYSHDRVGRQLTAATRFMWRPSSHQEAEYADFQACEWADTVPGFSGTGYIVFGAKPDAHVNLEAAVATAGNYRVTICYSMPHGINGSLQMTVNDASLNSPVHFPPTASNAWSTVATTLPLRAGRNKICLTAVRDDGPLLDYIDVEPIRLVESKQLPTNIRAGAATKFPSGN